MLFFKGKKNADGSQEPSQARTTASFLLRPHIGGSLQPIKESTTIFVNLLALIFTNQGLFPRNHPALTAKGGQGLTLWKVLGIAYDNLVFDRKHVPQILLFAAVIASIGFSFVAVFVALSSMFISTAHAQTGATTCGGGYFQPCDATQDIAMSWINYLFKGQPMYNYLGQFGQIIPQSQVIQGALITALGFYSDAILVVAAIILFYHLASMVVETAHHGVVMGKRANQIWAPIRLVVAIGLLVPISGGLNSGQYIVIQIAQWGSNLASQTWAVFVNKLVQENSQGVPANAPYVRKAVYDTVMMEACMYAYNTYQTGVPGSSCPQNSDSAQSLQCSGMQTNMMGVQSAQTNDKTTKLYYDTTSPKLGMGDQGACGHVLFYAPNKVDPSDQIAVAVQAATAQGQQAFYTMQNAARSYVNTNMVYFEPNGLGGQIDQSPPANAGDFEKLVTDYQGALQGLLNGVASDFSPAMTGLETASINQGWVSAGAWFNTIAREQSAVMDVSTLIPSTQAPALKGEESATFKDGVVPYLKNFELWLTTEDPSTSSAASSGSGLSSQQQQMMQAAAGFAQQQNNDAPHLMDKVFMAVDLIASMNGVWHSQDQDCGSGSSATNTVSSSPSCFSLGIQFTGANPLAEVAALGHANINTAYDLFDDYIKFLTYGGAAIGAVKALGGVTDATGRAVGAFGLPVRAVGILISLVGQTADSAKAIIGSLLGLICAVFFGTGALLAFYLPLLPFFRFLFNVLTWIVAMLEAVIAVPLIALAHLNPEGEGLPGASAKATYYFIFSIFLRPVLMVFGLMVGLLIFYIAVSYMNMLYLQAIAGAGGIAHGHLMMSRILYSVIYVFTIYMCANSAFHMIDWLPQHAMKWMGGQDMHYQKMGDPESMAQPIGLATGLVEQQVFGAAGKLTPAAAGALLEYGRGHLGDKGAMMKDLKSDQKQMGDSIQKYAGKEKRDDFDTAVDTSIQAGGALVDTFTGGGTQSDSGTGKLPQSGKGPGKLPGTTNPTTTTLNGPGRLPD